MEFQAWPKTARLFKDIVVTEKLDGTNAAIHIEKSDGQEDLFAIERVTLHERVEGNDASTFVEYKLGAQSRNRLITPEQDNAGFARWVGANADSLVVDLGPGLHFGEWWGKGIQRNYGLDHKRFSLFNTAKWGHRDDFYTEGLGCVPVLYEGRFDQDAIYDCLAELADTGSVAAPGFRNPEGICIFHKANQTVWKYTLGGDGEKYANAQ